MEATNMPPNFSTDTFPLTQLCVIIAGQNKEPIFHN